MNRLNQTEPATFSILLCWAFFRDSVFIYFMILLKQKSHQMIYGGNMAVAFYNMDIRCIKGLHLTAKVPGNFILERKS
jgi:hypothetical protein